MWNHWKISAHGCVYTIMEGCVWRSFWRHIQSQSLTEFAYSNSCHRTHSTATLVIEPMLSAIIFLLCYKPLFVISRYPSELNDLILEPLRHLFFCSSVYFKCQVAYGLTELLRNYIILELPRYRHYIAKKARTNVGKDTDDFGWVWITFLLVLYWYSLGVLVGRTWSWDQSLKPVLSQVICVVVSCSVEIEICAQTTTLQYCKASDL